MPGKSFVMSFPLQSAVLLLILPFYFLMIEFMQCILEAISVLMMYIIYYWIEFHELALFAFLIFKLRSKIL